ncbi:helix-turn-helix domain-containing protein [Myroides sp. LJL115]
MDTIRLFVKQKRNGLELTQQDLVLNAAIGLRFVRDLEQGKKRLRLNKVHDVLALFGREVGVMDKTRVMARKTNIDFKV